MTLPHDKHLLFWSAALVVGLAATTAEAQQRPRPSRTPSSELICLEELDAGATQPVVRALIGPDVEIVVDRQTNCLLIVGARDLTEARRVLQRLETRVVAWRNTQRQRRRTAHTPPSRRAPARGVQERSPRGG